MNLNYWYKQDVEPCFPDLAWSRPENRLQAGKLLIIGGNVHEFNAPAQAFAVALEAGIGTSRVLMPIAVKKQLAKFPSPNLEIEYTASTPSGSFASKSLADFLDHSSWSDGVLLAGNLGHNSETAILLEKYIKHYSGILLLTKDSVDYFVQHPTEIVMRPNTCLVLTIAQLQKIGTNLKFKTVFKFDNNILELVQSLHEFTKEYQINIILKHLNILYVASNGKVSTTKLTPDREVWRVDTGTKAVVWWIQNPTETFKAITASIADLTNKNIE
ncbi:hypothetical protein KC946_02010 [Candidatus Saccharibacteria bacterium]|nr:hypothetical protein [Candidatus Saccharibacteria bacterium]